jgi:hypothetical protein
MSDIRHKDGVPIAEDFHSTTGPPLVLNTQTGVLYTMTTGDENKPIALIVENRTDDPTDPEVGRIWLRTDLL